jgi:hypothetical protein
VIAAAFTFAAAAPVLATAEPPATVPAPAGPAAPAVSDNPFLPENENLTECISSLPGPNCGSKARGGWRQTVVFAVVVTALIAIGARIVYGVRRRDREPDPDPGVDQLNPTPSADGR